MLEISCIMSGMIDTPQNTTQGKILWERKWTEILLSKPDYYIKIWHIIIEETVFAKNHRLNRGQFQSQGEISSYFINKLQKKGGKTQKKLQTHHIQKAIRFFIKHGWIEKDKEQNKNLLNVVIYEDSQRFKKKGKEKINE